MYQHWDSSNINGGNDIGSTAIMQQQSSWYNTQIKTEPIDNHNSSQILPQNSNNNNSTSMDLLDPFRQLGVFNSLTPPGYSGLLFQPSFLNSKNIVSQTPSKPQDLSSSRKSNVDNNNSITPPPMDVTPPKSPTLAEHTPEKEEIQSNFNEHETQSESIDSYDEDSDDYGDDIEMMGSNDAEKIAARKQRKGSNKPRQYKCKQCKQIFHEKSEFWDHTRSHIKPEKMLQCPKCPFVTEYKHHLEYHLRNHSRSKPFQCPHCNYSCVNKSMLNSHLKSHSTVLQYRCVDCNYATKYCHSLKLHLRKYDHKPDIVLNLDGTPNPLPIIDVYGTRRGPKSKATTAKLLAEIEKNQAQQAVLKAQAQQLSPPLTPSTSSLATSTTNSITKTPPSSLALPNAALMVNMLQNVGNKMSLFPYFHLNLQMFAAQQQQQQQLEQQQKQQLENEQNRIEKEHVEEEEADTNFSEFMNLKSPATSEKKTKRKGKAFKFQEKIEIQSDDSEVLMTEPLGNESENSSNNKVTSSSIQSTTCENYDKSTTAENECKFCGIIFKDNVLFSLHIGYHSLGDDPFKCNMCGMKTDDKIQFFLHIAKFPHS